MGNDNYPSNITGVVTLLSNRREDRPSMKKIDDMKDGNYTSFDQVKFQATKKCHYCGNKGHLAFQYNKKKADQEKGKGKSDE